MANKCSRKDELSRERFPIDIVEDLSDPVSYKMCRACAYTSNIVVKL